MKSCRLCTRNFFGEAEKRIKDDVCEYCLSKIAKLKASLPFETSQEELEDLVSREQRRRLKNLSPSEMLRRIRESEKRDRET